MRLTRVPAPPVMMKHTTEVVATDLEGHVHYTICVLREDQLDLIADRVISRLDERRRAVLESLTREQGK